MKRRINNNRRPVSPLVLTDRDKAIILAVYQNRFLRRDQIQRLFFPETSVVACNMRLKKLYEHRFLDRLFKPVAVGSAQAVYALDKRGADILAATLQIDHSKVNWKRDHNRVEFLFLEHTLAVSEFKVGLDLALRTASDLDILFYKRAERSLQARVDDPRRRRKYLVVAPDAFFGLSSSAGKHYLFLEMDLGTETLSRFQEKIIAYKQFWKSGDYTERFGFRHFRVLTVTESDRRLANLIDTTAKAGGRNMFLFAAAPALEQSAPLGRVWRSPTNPSPTTLLE